MACFEASAEDHKCQASQDPSVRPQVLIVASSASKEKTQLRNLVWATSKHDVYLISNYSVMHWSSLTGNLSEIINFSGHVAPTEDNAALMCHPKLKLQQKQLPSMSEMETTQLF
ncbi:hypothetical protein K1719_044259 [Acacia pycnantha]|nr:hypothetical protein K1719_044259 [Acacia pycnantha]